MGNGEAPFVSRDALPKDPMGLEGKVYQPGHEDLGQTPGNPEATNAVAEQNKRINDAFNPVFDQMGIPAEPGTMGRELRAKLMNDLSQLPATSSEADIQAKIQQSVSEFKTSGQMGELSGKEFDFLPLITATKKFLAS